MLARQGCLLGPNGRQLCRGLTTPFPPTHQSAMAQNNCNNATAGVATCKVWQPEIVVVDNDDGDDDKITANCFQEAHFGLY